MKKLPKRNKQLHDQLSSLANGAGRHRDQKKDYVRAKEKAQDRKNNPVHEPGYFLYTKQSMKIAYHETLYLY